MGPGCLCPIAVDRFAARVFRSAVGVGRIDIGRLFSP
jgi:hypothetical protein